MPQAEPRTTARVCQAPRACRLLQLTPLCLHVPLPTCPRGHTVPREMASRVCLQEAFSASALGLIPTGL